MGDAKEKTYFVSYWIIAAYVIVSVVLVTTVGVAVHAAKTKCNCPEGTVRIEEGDLQANQRSQYEGHIGDKVNKRSLREGQIDELEDGKIPILDRRDSHHLGDVPSNLREKPERIESEDVVLAKCPTVPQPGGEEHWGNCKLQAWNTHQCKCSFYFVRIFVSDYF